MTTTQELAVKASICPYLLIFADPVRASLCVWSGAREPSGCNDGRVRILRQSRGEPIPKRMLCVVHPNTQDQAP